MSSHNQQEQKKQEKWICESARFVYPHFPPGEIEACEEPDLRIKIGTKWLGIEVTELLRLRADNNPYRPVQDEDFHKKVVQLAEKDYHRPADAEPACVGVSFLDDDQLSRENPEGWQRLASGHKAEKMASSLVEFVRRHAVPGFRSATFQQRELPGQMDGDTLPTGFELIGLSWPPAPWHFGESAAAIPALDPQQMSEIIKRKNDLLPKYRTKASPMWLLIYSGVRVSRGVTIPPAITEWRFAFDFDKVLLFSGMDNRVFEIGHLSRA